MRFSWLRLGIIGALAAFSATPAFAGPMLTLAQSAGVQPSNVGTITVTQDGTDSVIIDLTFLNSTYGILSSGTHIPFAFELNAAGLMGTLSISAFTDPTNGTYSQGTFTLDTSGGSQPGLGTFNVALDDSAGNGSGKAYYGELKFTLTSTDALDTTDLVKNSDGYYFTADLTNGSSTGAQGWGCANNSDCRTPPPQVPEPNTILLFGSALAALGLLRFRRQTKSV